MVVEQFEVAKEQTLTANMHAHIERACLGVNFKSLEDGISKPDFSTLIDVCVFAFGSLDASRRCKPQRKVALAS